MATTKVKNVCPICNEKVLPGKAMFVTRAEVTDKGEHSTRWHTYLLEEGLLRIKHLANVKPRFIIHIGCWNDWANRLSDDPMTTLQA